jgi:type VI secretion system protein ImpH
MGPKNWRTTTDIVAQLKNEPYDFDFYKAISIIEADFYRKQNININLAYEKFKHLDDFIQFHSKTSLAMPTANILSIDNMLNEDFPSYGKLNIVTTFLNLAGPFGALPQSMTQTILTLNKKRDYSLQNFMDIFHHRMLSKLYQIRRKHHTCLDIRPPTHNNFSNMLYAFTGHFTAAPKKFSPIPRKDLLYFSSLFAKKIRSASSLRLLLKELCRTEVDIIQCIGKWFALEESDWYKLGDKKFKLGDNTVIGQRAWVQTASMKIKIGPVSRKNFLNILPDSHAFTQLVKTINFYTLGRATASISLSIEKKEIKAAKLHRSSPPKLGWTSWLSANQPTSFENEIELHATK